MRSGPLRVVDVLQRPRRIAGGLGQQAHVVAGQSGDRRLVEELGGVPEPAVDAAVGALGEVAAQVEPGAWRVRQREAGRVADPVEAKNTSNSGLRPGGRRHGGRARPRRCPRTGARRGRTRRARPRGPGRAVRRTWDRRRGRRGSRRCPRTSPRSAPVRAGRARDGHAHGQVGAAGGAGQERRRTRPAVRWTASRRGRPRRRAAGRRPPGRRRTGPCRFASPGRRAGPVGGQLGRRAARPGPCARSPGVAGRPGSPTARAAIRRSRRSRAAGPGRSRPR